MVLINYATREIVAKIVYYGPGLGGKTTNLQHVFTRLNPKKRGKMISLATEADRTLFFDFLPVELGVVQGFKIRFQLYTVPGQVFYGATRKLVLKGADAIVFVADSQADVISKNVESVEDMKQNLMENGLDPNAIPIVFQYNKRDLSNIIDVMLLDDKINYRKAPKYSASAITGMGVMETFRGIVELLIGDLKRKHSMMDAGIKDLPPDMFEQKEEEPDEAELELGSNIRDEGPEGGKAKEEAHGSLLDQMETITLADMLQAEVFFDKVREGKEAEEAKRQAETAAPPVGIGPSHATGDFTVEYGYDDKEGGTASERELTPEELLDAEPVSAEELRALAEEIKEPVREAEPEGTNAPVFDIMPIVERMARLEEAVSALASEVSGLREKNPETDPSVQAEMVGQKISEAFEGHEKLMLSLLEAVRDLKKSVSDSGDRTEDALKRLLMINADAAPRKKGWF